MINKDVYRMEEQNLIEDIENYTQRKWRRKTKKEIERLVDAWILDRNIKIFNREKLLQRIFNDLLDW